MLSADRVPWCGLALAALALAACAGPTPPPGRPIAAAPVAADPMGAAYAREVEEQRRGIGIPPATPPPGAIDRVPGALRSSRPAPGVGPSAPIPPSVALPVPGNSQSRLSALPASPLANPRGGFMPGRP